MFGRPARRETYAPPEDRPPGVPEHHSRHDGDVRQQEPPGDARQPEEATQPEVVGIEEEGVPDGRCEVADHERQRRAEADLVEPGARGRAASD